ncbi:hypothetical protein [Paenibacillus chitinolyticus]|uniref:hypothetical protein n=1 Tax=Paenibacillus chitinolyticus TaxID=79263 RepID=UPI0036271BAD
MGKDDYKKKERNIAGSSIKFDPVVNNQEESKLVFIKRPFTKKVKEDKPKEEEKNE